MAYRFDGVDDYVQFAITPFSGYTFGAYTWAVFLKRNTASVSQYIVRFSASGGADKIYLWEHSGNTVRNTATSTANGPSVGTDTTNWLLIAITKTTAGTTPRFHVHNGTSWAHSNAASGTVAASTTISGTDELRVSSSPYLAADVVCAGIKKADSADATVETLSRTLFSAWQAFGFDWLIGFDSSLESAGILQDQGSAGTGGEIGITGTSQVSDPAGWTWPTPPASTFVPQITIV